MEYGLHGPADSQERPDGVPHCGKVKNFSIQLGGSSRVRLMSNAVTPLRSAKENMPG